MESIFDQLRQFSFPSMMLRVLLAMLMGGIVGFEREKKRRPAGFRTYMLVALGAAMTVMLSQYLDYMLNHQWLATASRIGIKTDVSRFGAQVINGVIVGVALIVISMKLLPLIEDAMLSSSRNMTIYVEMDSFENLGNIVNRIKAEGVHLYDVEIEKDKREHMARFSVLCSMRLPRRREHAELLAALSTLDGVVAIDEV